jgi:hypothetical protein
MQENYTKISKIMQLEVIRARRATMGHLVGPVDPTMPLVGMAPSVPADRS